MESKDSSVVPAHLSDFLESCTYLSKVDDARGRGIIAKQDIVPGQLLLRSNAVAWAVSDPFVDRICHNCFQTAPQLLLCSGCNFSAFCSAQCLNASRRFHAFECDSFKKLFTDGKYRFDQTVQIRMLVRMLAIRAVEDQLSKAKAAKGMKKTAVAAGVKKLVYKDVLDLMSHRAEASEEVIKSLKSVLKEISTILPAEIWPGDDEALELLLRIQCNAHGLQREDKLTYGLGLFPVASYLNHSCAPNCVWTFVEQSSGAPVMEFRAIKPIAEGEELCYSYVNIYLPSFLRKQKLLQAYYFMCSCPRCLDPKDDAVINGYACPKCSVGLVDDGVCLSCSDRVDESGFDEAMEYLRKISLEIQEEHYENAAKCTDLLLKLVEDEKAKKLHPHNFVMLDLYFLLIAFAKASENWEVVSKFAQLAINSLEDKRLGFEGTLQPEVASLYLILGNALAAKALPPATLKAEDGPEDAERELEAKDDVSGIAFERCKAALEKCVSIRTLCLGKAHSGTKAAEYALAAAIESHGGADDTKKKDKKKKKKKSRR